MCGQMFTDSHECPPPADIPAEKRQPTNNGGNVWVNLSRADKEQLDRIEALLQNFMAAQETK